MKNILVIKHGAFGDFIQALGCLRAIRRHHNDDHITLMTTQPFVEIAKASGYVDEIYVDVRPRWYQPAAWLRLKAWLNNGRFIRVYDLQNSERTGIYFKLFRKKPQWNGIAEGASHGVEDGPRRKAKHVFTALVDQLAKAGISGAVHDDLSWMQGDTAPLAVPTPYVLVAAGCSAKHKAKRWPHDRYAALCEALAARGFTPVLLGTNDEADVTARIKAACPKALDLTGKTSMFQIAVLAHGAAAAVGNDTGPIQMIGPTGCKTLGLYPGFSNPARHGPLGPHVMTIHKPAMADITLDEVQASLFSVLGL